jgi:hypothetical protein
MAGTESRDARRGMDVSPFVAQTRDLVPRRHQVMLRDVVRRYGVVTAGHRPLPDYLIVGTKKGGTTSLINWLTRHPNVLRMFPSAQRLKSAHYFDINFSRGERWYRSHFATAAARRRRAAAVDGPVIVGEASPYYMFHPAAVDRAHDTVPRARIIVLLRDPVSRAYSNYWDRRVAGAETLETFEQALEAEAERLASVDQEALRHDPGYYSFHHDNHSYLARGRYIEHLGPWLERFPREQMLVMCTEEMAADPLAALRQVEHFLGLPTFAGVPLSRYNEGPRPRAQMRPGTYRRLADYYRPHNAALYDAIGRDLRWEARYPPVGRAPQI